MKAENLFSLSGKIALVTGASRGIGEEIAKTLAANGAHVIVSSRKFEGCQRVVDEIAESGGRASAIPCHIGDMEQIDDLFSTIEKQFGQLDILVNNAATNPYFGHVLDTDLSCYDKTVDVNIRGYFFMSISGCKLMKEKGGSIINVASVNGVIPGDKQGIYSITKAAVISMTKTFAKECAEFGIRVNALLPGATDTKFAAALVKNPDILQNALLNHVAIKRVAEPSEMSGAVLYLASEAASYTTGTCLNVDGGYLIN